MIALKRATPHQLEHTIKICQHSVPPPSASYPAFFVLLFSLGVILVLNDGFLNDGSLIPSVVHIFIPEQVLIRRSQNNNTKLALVRKRDL